MPWIFVNGNGSNRRRRRRSNRAYDYGTDNYDRFPRYRRARRAYNNADYGDYADDDGNYDDRNDPIRLVIQTPADMLPPQRSANVTVNGQVLRSRARF